MMRDADRPPVLAHEKSAAARETLIELSPAERFVAIHDANLWGADTSASGLESEVEATGVIRKEMPGLVVCLKVRMLLDAPCGDACWIAGTDLAGIRCFGVDIVPRLIAENRAERAGVGTFSVADIIHNSLPSADAVLCRDCLFHLSFVNIARAVRNFRRSGARWLITTTFPQWQRNVDCEDCDWRALNLERSPFDWPAPLIVLNEGCEEAGGGWRDKSLAAWRFADLPDR